jgi:hypothetical protein
MMGRYFVPRSEDPAIERMYRTVAALFAAAGADATFGARLDARPPVRTRG